MSTECANLNKTYSKKQTLILSFVLTLAMMIFPVVSGVIVVVGKLDGIKGYYIQGCFMALSAIVPFVYIKMAKMSFKQVGFRRVNPESFQNVLFFIPLILAKIPFVLSGMESDVHRIIALIFFTLTIGFSEEIYFRGVIFTKLQAAFTIKQAVQISAIFFALAHVAQAFSGSNLLMVTLTVMNAWIFGIVAAELMVFSGSLMPIVLWHCLYDFINWTAIASGTTELVVITIQSVIIIAYAVYLWKKLPNKPETKTISSKQIKLAMED